MNKVVMPRIDPGMQTGFVVQWLKNEGDRVEKGEAVAIGEGEKTTFDIVSPASGILRRQIYPPKSEVPVTETIALIGEQYEELPAETTQPRFESSPEAGTIRREMPEREDGQVASPAARRLAREQNVDLSKVKGTGPGGRITREDVLKSAPEAGVVASGVPVDQNLPRIKMEGKLSATRRTIAERLSYSHQVTASASIMMDVMMDPSLNRRGRVETGGSRVSMTALIVKALAAALVEDQTFNSSLDGEVLRTYAEANVAVAIQTPDALVAPVVFNADRKSLAEITDEIGLLAEKAQERRLSLSELIGSTATVSNLGPEEVDAFIPIINPPNAIILGVGRISRRPIVVDDKIVPRSVSTFTLVFDHRIGDGVAAAKLLARVKQLLENPDS